MTFSGPSIIDIFENQELIKEYQELIRNKVSIEEELEFVMEHADEINIDKYILIATKHHLDIINNHKRLQDKFKQLLSSAKTEKEQEQARKIYENNYKEYEIRKDAIIIAERIFSNREKEKGIATGNATYIMRYEDYLILQEKQKELDSNHKKQIVQEVPGTIYSVNHRSGSWAMNLIKSIAKARAGSDFEEYNSIEKIHETLDWLHTLYNEDTIANIINYIKEIDDEEKHTYYLGFDKVYRKLFTDNEEYEYSYQYKKENA